MNEDKTIIGLSGGVDSSVAAFLLREQGHEVVGCFMRSFDTESSKRECELAGRLASRLGIDFLVVDRRKEFCHEVVSYLMRSYIEGRTPNPCCLCNRTVKWPALLDAMRETGAEHVATGHYAGVSLDESSGRWCIKKAVRLKKDQSYALYNLTQEELSHTLMPLYGYYKEDVRELARRIGLGTEDKPDSQEICFIESGDYVSFIKDNLDILFEGQPMTEAEKAEAAGELRKRIDRKGSFVDTEGRVLGTHQGIISYTIGQRKGLNIALGRRAFVKEILPDKGQVVLSDDAALYTDSARVRELNWQLMDPETLMRLGAEESIEADVKVRYGHQGTRARLSLSPEQPDEVLVRFCEPVRAVTPGQAAVFYDDEQRILGGGIIV